MFIVYVDKLVTTFIGVLQGGCGVECTPSSERVAAARSNYGGCSIHNGVRVDDAWENHRVCEGVSGCGSVRTGRFFI